jgi:nucleotide-binding universal stress UspA family protein
MFHKIVVPIDGSEPSEAAVALALRMAREDDAEVIFVHAVELNKIAALAGPAPIDPSLAIDAACRVGQELLDDVKKRAEQAGVHCICELPEDECVGSVLEIARQRKADLIVIGSHGRSGIPRALLGSVAEGILRRSPIPVLVCHAPPHGHHQSDFVKTTAKNAEETII